MKRIVLTMALLLIAVISLIAQRYPSTSYEVKNGNLMKWLGPETEIDFTQDSYLMNTVEDISSNAFADNANIKSVKFSYTQNYVGMHVFYNCPNLETVIFDSDHGNPYWGAEPLRIETGAFRNCPKLKSVTFSKYLDYVAYDAFEDCPSLTSFSFSGKHPQWLASNGIIYSRSRDTLVCFPPGITGHYDLYDRVEVIREGAFAYSHLSSIYMQGQVKEIGDYAFDHAIQLEAINFPSSLRSIGKWAFNRCADLKTLVLPSSLESIQYYAFRGCTSLPERVKLPTNLMECGAGAFSACYSIKAFEVPTDNPYFSTEDGVLMNKYKDVLVAYPQGKSDVYTLPKSVSKVENLAFIYSTIREVTFNAALKEIGEGAFSWCDNLERIDLPEGLETIGDRAFYNCHNLKEIHLPSTLQSLHLWAFCKPYLSSEHYDPRTVFCLAPSPVGSWRSEDVTTDTLYVPEESIALYRMAPGWRDFASIRPIHTPQHYTVSYNEPANGLLIVSVDGKEIVSGTEVLENSVVTIEAIPYYGYVLESVKVNDVAIDPQQPFVVTGNTHFVATFVSESSAGIDHATNMQTEGTIVYDLQGRRLSRPQRGLNIVRSAKGGMTKKFVVTSQGH